MDLKLSAEERRLKEKFEEFFEREMKNAPSDYVRSLGVEAIYGSEEAFAFHKRMARKMGEKGWIAMAWPKEHGGRDASIMEQLIFNEARGRRNAPGIDGFGVRMFASSLLVGGSEEQKRRLLPPIAGGEAFYCQGWSEPDAGSDLASLTTLAIRDKDEYVINGQKTWTTGAHMADHMFLLARTDPDSKRNKGLSVFVIEMDSPGVEVRPLLYMNGRHVYNDVFFRNVRVSAENLIGTEGEGWALTRQTMNFERGGSGNFALLKGTIYSLIRYMKETKRDGKYLSEDPENRRKIARLFADAELGRTLAYKIAWHQRRKDFRNLVACASASKVLVTELSQRLANCAMEIIGPYGQVESSSHAPLNGVMAELYQFCVGQNIYAGSNEIQRNLIAWAGLELPRMKFKT